MREPATTLSTVSETWPQREMELSLIDSGREDFREMQGGIHPPILLMSNVYPLEGYV
jgi:hypothetical protein